MAEYEAFARFYDQLMGDPAPKSARVLEAIDRYLPDATSVLELGCGTGAILAGLRTIESVTGVDRSPDMLAIARAKGSRARLVEADMVTVDLGERFDAVICVFDTLNHLPRFEDWIRFFERVHAHLTSGGLFIFDVNTLGRLRRLGDAPPWVHDFDGNTVIMDVECDAAGLSTWDIRVFEREGGRFVLHHERILELGVELARIVAALDPGFDVLEATDPAGLPPTDSSDRAHFVCRRRS